VEKVEEVEEAVVPTHRGMGVAAKMPRGAAASAPRRPTHSAGCTHPPAASTSSTKPSSGARDNVGFVRGALSCMATAPEASPSSLSPPGVHRAANAVTVGQTRLWRRAARLSPPTGRAPSTAADTTSFRRATVATPPPPPAPPRGVAEKRLLPFGVVAFGRHAAVALAPDQLAAIIAFDATLPRTETKCA